MESRNAGIVPVVVITREYSAEIDVPNTPHLRYTFRRAADNLVSHEAIQGWYLPMPSRTSDSQPPRWRDTLCVAMNELELTDALELVTRGRLDILNREGGTWLGNPIPQL